MDEYLEIGIWFGIPAFILTWIGCIIYAISEYGWFIGTPMGFFIGGFFAVLSGFIAAFLWPILALGIIYIIYNWKNF